MFDQGTPSDPPAAPESTNPHRVVCEPRARDALLRDLADRPRIEACGLVLGRSAGGSWIAEDMVPLRNVANRSDYFEFDAEELVQHDLEHGDRIIGAYHSHPGGPSRPSTIDVGNMRALADSPWIWLIASPRGTAPLGVPPGGSWRAAGIAAFRVASGQLMEYPVEVAQETAPDMPPDAPGDPPPA
jgi:proteasome lid subunit RPN8/RPN11